MFSSVGVPELVLVFVIGLLILGPERLPRVASQIGRWVGKARRTANQLRYQMEREIALADIERTKTRKPETSKQNTPDDAGAPAETRTGTDSEGNTAADAAGGTETGPATPPPADADTAAPAESAARADTVEADADKS